MLDAPRVTGAEAPPPSPDLCHSDSGPSPTPVSKCEPLSQGNAWFRRRPLRAPQPSRAVRGRARPPAAPGRLAREGALAGRPAHVGEGQPPEGLREPGRPSWEHLCEA